MKNTKSFTAIIRPNEANPEDRKVSFLASGFNEANSRALQQAADMARKTGVEHRVVRVEESAWSTPVVSL